MNWGFVVLEEQINKRISPNTAEKLDDLEGLLEMQIIGQESPDGNEAKETNLFFSESLIKSLPIHIPEERGLRPQLSSDTFSDGAKVHFLGRQISADKSEKDQFAH